MVRHRFVTLVLLTSFILVSFASDAQRLWGGPRMAAPVKPPDSILVRFRPGMTIAGMRRVQTVAAAAPARQNAGPVVRAKPLVWQREIPKLGIQVYHMPDATQLNTYLTALRRMPEVLYAEPNYHFILLSDPNDPYYSKIETITSDPKHVLFEGDEWRYQWPLLFVQAVAAWGVWPKTYYTATTKPANSVKVAVIDTGVDKTHPDFINAGGTSTDALYGGQLDLADSRDFFGGSITANPADDYGHGTHVTGIIAAATNNSVGIAALGFPSQVMVLKVTDPSGDGDDADVVTAMIWAADHGAMVINMSIAVNGGYSQALQDAVNYCWGKNALIVAAAGNDGVDYVRRYPAACDKVLAVAATTFASAGTIPPYEANTSYSNSGLYVGIAAPGGDATFWNGTSGLGTGLQEELYTQVWSTTPTYPVALTEAGLLENNYGYLEGTSMASPHVAALASLYAGYKGYTQSTAQAPLLMMRAIQKGSDNIAGRSDGGWTTAVGHGRINALATLQDTFGDGRGATTPGCITGQVTYYGTPVQNASVTATLQGTNRSFNADSKEDGNYRLANVPAGTYNVSCQYFGIIKNSVITVLAARDSPANDFEMDASNIVVTVTPHTVTINSGDTYPFSATVTGTSNTGVLWSVIDGPGSIGANGVYHAPFSGVLPPTVTIQASSLVDPTRSDTAVITVIGHSSLLATATLVRNGSQIQATVTVKNVGTANTTNAQITLVKLKDAETGTTVTGSPLPVSLGTLAVGASTTVVLTFDGSVGTSGQTASVSVGGNFTGGTFASTQFTSLP